MNKFLIATLAVLCTLFMSCSKQEIDFDNQHEQQVQSRASGEIDLSYLDTNGVSQTVTCKEAQLTYISSSSIELIFTYTNGSTQTILGNDISILPQGPNLKVSTSASNSFLATKFDIESCNTLCCYTYNSTRTAGTGSFFIVEEEPMGW